MIVSLLLGDMVGNSMAVAPYLPSCHLPTLRLNGEHNGFCRRASPTLSSEGAGGRAAREAGREEKEEEEEEEDLSPVIAKFTTAAFSHPISCPPRAPSPTVRIIMCVNSVSRRLTWR